jgi:hypothetical protein
MCYHQSRNHYSKSLSQTTIVDARRESLKIAVASINSTKMHVQQEFICIAFSASKIIDGGVYAMGRRCSRITHGSAR